MVDWVRFASAWTPQLDPAHLAHREQGFDPNGNLCAARQFNGKTNYYSNGMNESMALQTRCRIHHSYPTFFYYSRL